MTNARTRRVIKHASNDNQDSPPPGGFSGGAAARPPRVERVDAIAPHANDNTKKAAGTQVKILKEFAELDLAIAVHRFFFEHCHSLSDFANAILGASELERLGICTALILAVSALGSMVRTGMHGCGLPPALRAARRRLAALVHIARAWRRPH